MSFGKRIAVAFIAVVLVSLTVSPGAGATVTPTGPVSASATGVTAPSTAIEPATVTNGDFTIVGQTAGSLAGDGVDERNEWSFDFSSDPDFGALPASGTLSSASLVLTLTPGSGGAVDDGIAVGALSAVTPAELAGLQAAVTETVTVDLLGLYSAHQILDEIAAGGGVLAMRYEDDAVVSFAELVLVAAAEEEIFASDAGPSDLFGFSVDISGTTAVVGAPGAAGSGLPGKVYVFSHDGAAWTEQAILSATVPINGEQFGYDVSIDGGTIVVGARGVGGVGSAYVFTGSGATWTQASQLGSGVSGSVDDQFGTSVDLDGSQLIVGAPTDDQLGANTGAAYLFEDGGSGWVQTLKLGSQSPSANGLFGDAVLVTGGEALVGAPIEAAPGFSLAGSVYAYDAATGAHLQTLEPSDRQSFHGFGTSLSLDGGVLAIGANGDQGPAGFDPTCTPGSGTCNPGSVYLYSGSAGSYTFDTELHASDLDIETNFSPGSQFGLATDLVGGTLIVGARHNEGRTTSIGKAHVFDLELGSWTPTVRLVASDSRQGDLLGNAVAIFGTDGDDFLVGAPNDDHAGGLGSANDGAVYAFGDFVVAPAACDGMEPTIIGTAGDDVIVGTVGSDVIVGLGGNDIIEGGNGSDVICGGSGADQLSGENGQDVLLGGGGDDVLSGGNGKDSLNGGAGTDSCDGGNGKDVEIDCE